MGVNIAAYIPIGSKKYPFGDPCVSMPYSDNDTKNNKRLKMKNTLSFLYKA